MEFIDDTKTHDTRMLSKASICCQLLALPGLAADIVHEMQYHHPEAL